MMKPWIKFFYLKNILGKKEFTVHFTDSISLDYFEGNLYWYKDGKLSKENGPAVIHKSGNIFYYLDGEPHRIDGPAKIDYDGTKEYLVEGKLHRADGPAIERLNGRNEWWYKGQFISSSEDGFRKFMKLKAFM